MALPVQDFGGLSRPGDGDCKQDQEGVYLVQAREVYSQSALLVLYEEKEIRQSWPLEAKETTIGRWPDNDIVIADRWVSRHHARIERRGLRYVIEDLGSKNDTFVNGERLTAPHELEDGDRIQIAPQYQFTFVDAEATAPVRPAEIGLRLDTAQRQVWVAEQEVPPPLSPAQFAFLELLSREPERVFSRDEIIAAVWSDSDSSGVSDDAIDSLVRRLRKRLAKLDPDHDYIETVRGHGFRLVQHQ
jgi:pSer/pThr/pTyr-binding forkhead associated (FHA) protein